MEPMRRKDREITEFSDIVEVLGRCDVVRLGLNDDGYPYILPLNFGMDTDGEKIRLYFHSALEGHKVGLIEKDPRASFEADTKHELGYYEEKGYCTYYYESVMGRGRITVLEGEEKQAALEKLMEHYHPGKNAYFNPAAIPRTLVYRLDVEEVTGKRKMPKG